MFFSCRNHVCFCDYKQYIVVNNIVVRQYNCTAIVTLIATIKKLQSCLVIDLYNLFFKKIPSVNARAEEFWYPALTRFSKILLFLYLNEHNF